MWSDLWRDLPQGQPEEGDGGLDYTHTWARTYWGGALFCFVADVEIRKESRNRKGLQHPLRAINSAGGTIETEWPLERALKIGDQATDTDTLTGLYRKMASTPIEVDLSTMSRQLGVDGGPPITFRPEAPLASIRYRICG